MKTPSPIIFTHYGVSPYLGDVFKMVKRSNPNTPVILLGDEQNRSLAMQHGIRHLAFTDYGSGELIETFDRVYELIQGHEHSNIKGGRDWVNFVFKRWFYIYNFLKDEGVTSFWHFDSDTMILSSLAEHESTFADYDCTDQCNGCCLNGFIPNINTVEEYLITINELFQDDTFKAQQKKEFREQHPKFAFTEMRAYEYYKHKSRFRPRTIRLNTITQGITFDDSLRQPHGMVMEPFYQGKYIKKIYVNQGGRFHCQHKISHATPQVISLNMSWVPLSFYKTVLKAHRYSMRMRHPLPEITQGKTLSQFYNTLPRKLYFTWQHYRHVVRTVLLPKLFRKKTAA
jgi:hypothetical protein